MLQELMTALQTAAITAAIAAITALSAVFIAWVNALKNKALKSIQNMEEDHKQTQLDKANEQLDRLTTTVVMSIEQEEKQELLKMVEDNRIDEEELRKLREMAVNRIIDQLSPDAKEILEANHGDINTYTSDLVSRKVLELKLLSNK